MRLIQPNQCIKICRQGDMDAPCFPEHYPDICCVSWHDCTVNNHSRSVVQYMVAGATLLITHCSVFLSWALLPCTVNISRVWPQAKAVSGNCDCGLGKHALGSNARANSARVTGLVGPQGSAPTRGPEGLGQAAGKDNVRLRHCPRVSDAL
jgi:hypothetical protein